MTIHGHFQEVACIWASGPLFQVFVWQPLTSGKQNHQFLLRTGQKRYPKHFVSCSWLFRALAERKSWTTVYPSLKNVQVPISPLFGEWPDNLQVSMGCWRPRIAKLMKSNREVFWIWSLFSGMLMYFMCLLLAVISTGFLYQKFTEFYSSEVELMVKPWIIPQFPIMYIYIWSKCKYVRYILCY